MSVVWLQGLALSCVLAITEYCECLLKSSQLYLLWCCKQFFVVVTAVVIAIGVPLRQPSYTRIPALLLGLPCSTPLLYFSTSFSPPSLISLAAIIRVIGIRWCWLNWKGMQTGLWGFSARENQLEERTQDSREEWRSMRSTVTHSAALALIKLAGFCRKHTNKLRGLMESECCRMLAVLEVWCQERQYTWTEFGKTFKLQKHDLYTVMGQSWNSIFSSDSSLDFG